MVNKLNTLIQIKWYGQITYIDCIDNISHCACLCYILNNCYCVQDDSYQPETDQCEQLGKEAQLNALKDLAILTMQHISEAVEKSLTL